MRIMNRFTRVAAVFAALGLCAVTAASCGIEKQGAPALAGPSEFGTSITVTATPDIVNRDGESQAVVTVTVRDAQGQPVAGLPLALSVSPFNGGVLSAAQVTSGADGRASAVFTAPSLNTPVSTVTIGATPIGSNFDNAVMRSASVALAGPAGATPSFTVAPANPQRFQLTTLDASATTLSGVACASNCQYSWRLGSEATLTGQTVNYRFQQEATYVVTLDVTSPGGVLTSTSRPVTVAAAPLPQVVITVSPTSPLIGQTVFLSGAASTASNGATIVEYTWDFGNGAPAASGVSATTTYSPDGTYVIRLTVRDSNGLVGTATQSVTVRTP
jgi:PKD repeat protein